MIGVWIEILIFNTAFPTFSIGRKKYDREKKKINLSSEVKKYIYFKLYMLVRVEED